MNRYTLADPYVDRVGWIIQQLFKGLTVNLGSDFHNSCFHVDFSMGEMHGIFHSVYPRLSKANGSFFLVFLWWKCSLRCPASMVPPLYTVRSGDVTDMDFIPGKKIVYLMAVCTHGCIQRHSQHNIQLVLSYEQTNKFNAVIEWRGSVGHQHVFCQTATMWCHWAPQTPISNLSLTMFLWSNKYVALCSTLLHTEQNHFFY